MESSETDNLVETGLNMQIVKPVLETEPICMDILNETKNEEKIAGETKSPIVTEEAVEIQNINKNEIKLLGKIDKPFNESKLGRGCFIKGCKWSPDGTCLLSSSEDNIMRLFDLSDKNYDKDLTPVLTMREGGTVYDFVWYPLMNSNDPISCVFACTSSGSPIHLWDAYTGLLRCTYQPIDQFDEVTTAFSLKFSPDGSKLYSGFRKCLRIFDTSLPGRESCVRYLKHEPVHQSNIISCIDVNPVLNDLYVLGSYDRTIGLYTEPKGDLLCILKGHKGGVTQVMFSPDGIRLYSGARKDGEILCWDMRSPGDVLHTFTRHVDTNQRIYFDLNKNGSCLVSGSTCGHVQFYNVNEMTEDYLHAHDDCVSSVSLHPTEKLMSTGSGQRHYLLQEQQESDNDDDDIDCDRELASNKTKSIVENTIKIWSYG